MRVKILDAMAMGLPIVTTSVGCEGISLRHGEHAMVADTPDDFARSVVHLLQNPVERARLGAAGRRFVECHYGLATDHESSGRNAVKAGLILLPQ